MFTCDFCGESAKLLIAAANRATICLECAKQVVHDHTPGASALLGATHDGCPVSWLSEDCVPPDMKERRGTAEEIGRFLRAAIQHDVLSQIQAGGCISHGGYTLTYRSPAGVELTPYAKECLEAAS